MATTQVTFHFHGDEPLGAGALASLSSSASAQLAASPPLAFPQEKRTSLQHVLRLAESLGAPVLLSMSNERLTRAAADPVERKALSNGVSRQRLLPVPTTAFATEAGTLAPFEIADEVRLNVDRWKLLLVTPPFALPPSDARQLVVSRPDPAAHIGAVSGGSAILGFNLDAIEASGDVEGAFGRLQRTLAERKDFRFSRPAAGRPGWIDHFLRDLLESHTRPPKFRGKKNYYARTDGFPLDLARALASPEQATRSLSGHASALVGCGFDIRSLEPKIARGVLLRWLSQSAALDVPKSEWVRLSFMRAAVLLDDLANDGSAEPDGDPAKLPQWMANAVERCASAVDAVAAAREKAGDTKIPRGVTTARQALGRAKSLVPEAPSSGRGAIEAAQKLVAALVKVLNKAEEARVLDPGATAEA